MPSSPMDFVLDISAAGNAPPVVFHFQNKPSRQLLSNRTAHLGGPGVADDVGQGFLKDAEERRAQVLLQLTARSARYARRT